MGQWSDEQQQVQRPVLSSHPAQGPEVGGPTIIEGWFTYDALEDLLLYLCSRRETLTWQLTTLAGSFTLLFDQGQPADIMFRPVRPIGAYVGLRALQTLFQQQGGQFTVQRGLAALDAVAFKRRSLNASGENLLIAMAALNDEQTAPAVLAGTTVDNSAEAALVADVPPEDHRTAFATLSSDTPLVDVLQLFSVSRCVYRVSLFGSGSGPIGQIDLSANQVGRVTVPTSAGPQGQAALHRLLSLSLESDLRIEVNPLAAGEWPAAPVGKLDRLLLKATLEGALMPEPPSAGPATPPAPGDAAPAKSAQINPMRVNTAQISPGPVSSAGSSPSPSPLQRLRRLLRRR